METYLGDGVTVIGEYPDQIFELVAGPNKIFLSCDAMAQLFDFHKNMLDHYERPNG